MRRLSHVAGVQSSSHYSKDLTLASSTRTSVSSAGAQSVAGPVLHAFAAWLKLSAGAGLDGATLAGHPLTKAAMEGLMSVDTFEDASDAVCELVMCTSVRGEPEQQMMPLVQLLVPAVSLDPTIVQHGIGTLLDLSAMCHPCTGNLHHVLAITFTTWQISACICPTLHCNPHLLTHRHDRRLCVVLCHSCIG